MSDSRKRIADGAFLLALMIYILVGARSVPVHGDEFMQMSMARDVVRLEVVGGLAERERKLGLAPSARDARFGVGNQMPGIDHPRLDQRQESELDRGGIATRIADNPGFFDRFPMHLRQAIDRFGEST